MSAFGNPFQGGGWQGAFYVPPNTAGSSILENNPDAAWQRLLGSTGLGGAGASAFGQWAQRQGGTAYNRFLADSATPGQPTRYLDWLNQNAPNLFTEFGSQSAQGQGLRPGQYTGRLRWLGMGS